MFSFPKMLCHALFYMLAWAVLCTFPSSRLNGDDLNRVFNENDTRRGFIITFKEPPLAQLKRSSRSTKKHTQLSKLLRMRKDSYQSVHIQCRETLRAYREKKNCNEKIPHRQKHFYYLINGITADLSQEELIEMKKLPFIDTIYPDMPISLLLTESIPIINADSFSQSSGATGTGIVVAVIDTGIDYLHPDLGGGIGASFKVAGGYDFVNDDDDPMDDNGHGTHVSGIIAANGTLKGVAPDARLLAYKVLNTAGNGVSSDIIAALERAADPDDNPATDDAADIVNISIGGFGHPDDAVSLAVDNAVAEGIVCVVAAGNESDYFSITTPGASRDAITVGAASKTLEIAPFSSRGPTNQLFLPKPDILAPGVSINSTIQDGKYGFKSGTSMATPHVAGATALLLQAYPHLTPQEIKNLLRETAVSIGKDSLTQGSGIIDLGKTIPLSLLISPSVIFLGTVDDNVALWQANASLSLKNMSGASTSATLTWTSSLASGIDVDFPEEIGLDTDETVSFSVDISVNTTQVESLVEPPYIYEGYLNITNPQQQTYRVQFIFQKEQPDPFEPNNFFSQASAITLSAKRTIVQDNGRTKIDPSSGEASTPDFDWFSFSADAGDTISLDINAQDISSPLNAKITLYDSALNQLFTNDTFHSHVDPQIRDFTLTTAGTHYIKVEGSNNTLGAYHLNTHKTPETIEWLTDISGVNQIDLFKNGMRTLLTYSTKIDVLDNYNAGLQLMQIQNLSVLKTASSMSASTFAVLENKSGSRTVSVYDDSSATPIWKHTFSPDYSPSDIVVSANGSVIAVYSVDALQQNIIIHTFNHTSNFPQLVFTQPSFDIQNNGFEISASGGLVLFSDANKTYILDTASKKLRWAGPSVDRALHMSSDGTYLAGSASSFIFRLYKWNGTTYLKEWDFNPGNGQKIFRSAISATGDILVMGQRLQTGYSAGLEDEGLHFYFFNRISNVPLYEYRIIKNLLDVPKDDLFGIKLPNAIDEILISPNGKEIVAATWGADPQQAELLIFSPEYPVPLADYFSHGSINDAALNNNSLNFLSAGKHNFHFFRTGIDQQIITLNTAEYTPLIPPFIKNATAEPLFAELSEPIVISAQVTDSDGISVVTAEISEQNGFVLDTVILHDNGILPDSSAGDSLYTASWIPLDGNPHTYYIRISAHDIHNATAYAEPIAVTSYPTPVISALSVQLDNDSSLHPGAQSFVSFTLKNTGDNDSGTLEFSIFIQDPHIESYTRTPIPLASLSPLEEVNTPYEKIAITPTYTSPSEHYITIHCTVTSIDGTQWTQQIPLLITDTAPPYAQNIQVTPHILAQGAPITVTANLLDGSGVSGAKIHIFDTDNDASPVIVLPLFDDGQHSDQFASDLLFGTSWITSNIPRDYRIDLELRDTANNTIMIENAATFTTKPYISQNPVLLVDDTKNEQEILSIYQSDLMAIGHNYDIWSTENDGEIISSILSQYTQGIVLWIIGETSGLNHLSPAEQTALIAYLQNGGNLIITGQRLSYYLSIYGLENNVLMNDYLAADFVFKDTNATHLIGVDENALSAGTAFTLHNQLYTGEIDPVSEGTILLKYDTDIGAGITFSSQAAAIQHSTDIYRAFFFDFDFSGLQSANGRQTLLERMINFSTAPKFANIAALPPVSMPESMVTLSVSVFDPDGLLSVSATIEDSNTVSIATVPLYDDGTHGDLIPNDSLYTAYWQTPATADDFSVSFTATDTSNNTAQSVSPAHFTTHSAPFIEIETIIPFSNSRFAPAELVFFDISVQNSGTLTSTALTAALTVSDPYVEYAGVINGQISSLLPSASYTSQNGSFYLKLSPVTPHNHIITLTLQFTDTSNSKYIDTALLTVADTTAPLITAFHLSSRQVLPNEQIGFSATVLDGEPIAMFELTIRDEQNKIISVLPLFDDGQHADSLPNDFFFAAHFTTPPEPHTYSIEAVIRDVFGNESVVMPIEMFTTIQFIPRNEILLIDDTASFNDNLLWFTDYFIEKQIPFDLWKTSVRGSIPTTILTAYSQGTAVWHTGTGTAQSFSIDELENIQGYLNTGGNILLSGEKNAFHIAGIYGQGFLNTFFHINHIQNDISVSSLLGVASDPISDTMALSLHPNSVSGEIAALPPATPLFYYDQSAGSGNILDAGIAAVSVDTGIFKTVFLDFSWDTITSDPKRKELLNKIFLWFGNNQTPYLNELTIEPVSVSTEETVLIKASLLNQSEIQTVFAHIQTLDNIIAAQLLLFDDATHGDIIPLDGIFSRSYLTLPIPQNYYIDVIFKRTDQSELTYDNAYYFTTKAEPTLHFSGYMYENNSVLQPGNITSIGLKIKNDGLASSSAVQCSVELNDEFIQFYQTSPIQFGTIPSGTESADSEFSFFISLSHNTPDNYSFNGHVFITDSSGYTVVDRIFFTSTDSQGPAIDTVEVLPKQTSPGSTVTIAASLTDGSGIASVTARLFDFDNSLIDELALEQENESARYSASWTVEATPRNYMIQIVAKDTLNNEMLSTTATWFTSIAFSKRNPLLLVIPQSSIPNEHPYHTHLNLLGIGHDIWDEGLRGTLTNEAASLYTGETIIIPRNTSNSSSFSTALQSTLAQHLDNDGRLILSGSSLVSSLTVHGTQSNSFLETYFHTGYLSSQINVPDVEGIAPYFFENDTFSLDGNPAGEISVSEPAEPILRIDPLANPEHVIQDGFIGCAVSGTGNGYRALLYNFAFESIEFAEKKTLFLSKSIAFLTENMPGIYISDFTVDPVISSPGSTFDFQGIVSDHSSVSTASIHIKDSTGAIIDTLQLYDDGAHNDGSAGDGVFGAQWTSNVTPDFFTADISIIQLNTMSYYYNSLLTFTTQTVPWLKFDHVTIASPAYFRSSAPNFFDIYLINTGSAPANDVKASISTDNPYVSSLSATTFSYGTIVPSAVKKENGAKYSLSVHPLTPHGTLISLSLNIAENGSLAFQDSFTIVITDTAPPDVSNLIMIPTTPSVNDTVSISAYIKDGTGIQTAEVHLTNLSGTFEHIVQLFDDGLHNDVSENDGIYGASLAIPSLPDEFKLSIFVEDTLANTDTSAEMLYFSTKPFSRKNTILLIDQQPQDPLILTAFEKSLQQNGYGYDAWKTTIHGTVTLSILELYADGIVVWNSASIDEIIQQSIQLYLQQNGCIIISGTNFVGNLSENGFTVNELLESYFQVRFIDDVSTVLESHGLQNDPLGNGLNISFLTPSASEIEPFGNANAFLQLESDVSILSEGIIASYVSNGYQSILLNFAFDAITFSSQQNALVSAMLNWIGRDTGPRLIFCTASPSAVTPFEPVTLSAELDDPAGISSVTLEIFDNSGTVLSAFDLFDDATHGDVLAGDSIFTNSYTPQINNTEYTVCLTALNMNGTASYFIDCAEFFTIPKPIFEFVSYTLQGSDHIPPGITTFFGISIKNSGTIAAHNVSVSLSISDPFLDTVSTIPVSFGSINPQATISSAVNSFHIKPAYSCPDTHQFATVITISDNTGILSADTFFLPIDDTTPPYLNGLDFSSQFVYSGNQIRIQAELEEGTGIAAVNAVISSDDGTYSVVLELYDDGTNSDEKKGDGIYTVLFTTPYTPHDFSVEIYAEDLKNNAAIYQNSEKITTKEFISQNRVLLIDDDGDIVNGESAYTAMLNAAGIGYDYWNAGLRGYPDQTLFNHYVHGCVVLFTGFNDSAGRISLSEQIELIAYLDHGGSLILSGSNNSYLLTNFGSTSNILLNNYLHAQFQQISPNLTEISGVSGEPITDSFTAQLTAGNAGETDPVIPGTPILQYSGTATPYVQSTGTAAIKTDSDTYKTLFFDFQIEHIANTTARNLLFEKSIRWCLGPHITNPSLSAGWILPGNSIDIFCSVSDSLPISLVTAEIESPDETTIDTIQLNDEGIGNDAVNGDGIFSGTYMTSTSPAKFIIDFYAENSINNYSRLNNALSFTTQSVPYLSVQSIDLAEGSNFVSNKKNYFDITLYNEGIVSGQSTTVTLLAGDPFIASFETAPVLYGTVAPLSASHKTPTAFFLETSVFTPHNRTVDITVTLNTSAGLTSYSYQNNLTISIIDNDAPQVIQQEFDPVNPSVNSLIELRCSIAEGTTITSVTAHIKTANGSPIVSLALFDDGIHADGEIDDYIFGTTWITPSTPDNFVIDIETSDSVFNSQLFANRLFFTTIPFSPASDILLINADFDNEQSINLMIESLDNTGIPFDLWDMKFRQRITEPLLSDYQYGTVIIHCGENGITYFKNSDYEAIRIYLANAGNLFIAGELISITAENSIEAHYFLNKTLFAFSVQHDTGSTVLNAALPNSLGMPPTLSLADAQTNGEVDVLPPAYPLYSYDTLAGSGQTLSSGTGAFYVDTSNSRIIVCDFRFGNIDSSISRNVLVKSSVAWLIDHDNDGTTDPWEIGHFGSIEAFHGHDDPDNDGLDNQGEQSFGTNPLSPDSDSDGFSDLSEKIAGTDPLNPLSFFAITSFELDNNGATITWDSVSGKTYAVFYSTIFPQSFADYVPIGFIEATSETTSYLDTGTLPERPIPTSLDSGWYLVVVVEN